MGIEIGGKSKMVIETTIRDKYGNVKEHSIEGMETEKEEVERK